MHPEASCGSCIGEGVSLENEGPNGTGARTGNAPEFADGHRNTVLPRRALRGFSEIPCRQFMEGVLEGVLQGL